jgi:flagellar assembly protein FliH
MELPLLPEVEPAGGSDAGDDVVDDGAGARLIGFAAGHREGCRAGREEGFAEGYADGVAAGRADASARVEELAGSLGAALAERRARWDDEVDRVAGAVMAMALEVAAAVLDREVASLDDPGLDAVQRALRALPAATDTSGAVLHLHPEDADAFGGHPALPDVRVVPDPDVEPGACRLQVGDTDVDAGIASALCRAREVLAP